LWWRTGRRFANHDIVNGISTIQGTVRSGDLFIALKGDKFDGHNFINDVIEKGASAILVERSADLSDVAKKCAVVYVNNTRKAFGDIARRYRKDFDIPVIAVCGSNGKSTTKELIASVLSSRFKVHKSPGSLTTILECQLHCSGLNKGIRLQSLRLEQIIPVN
jgi:UDP-N-acetylmuramyl pentapeptide synthase